jgi:hypothetical protein
MLRARVIMYSSSTASSAKRNGNINVKLDDDRIYLVVVPGGSDDDHRSETMIIIIIIIIINFE